MSGGLTVRDNNNVLPEGVSANAQMTTFTPLISLLLRIEAD